MKFYGYNTPTGAVPFPINREGKPKYWVAVHRGKCYAVYIKSLKTEQFDYSPEYCDHLVDAQDWVEVIPANNLKELFD
jgi:hypothetical protein